MGEINYTESFAFGEFWRKEIAPNLRHLVPNSTNFTEYLQGYYKTLTTQKTFGVPLPYVYTLEWVKRYKDKCVTFMYNSPDEVAKGASALSAIYQLSPKMHALAHIYLWRDDGENDGHVIVFIIYEAFQDVLNFAENNIDMIKKPKPEQKGFALVSN